MITAEVSECEYTPDVTTLFTVWIGKTVATIESPSLDCIYLPVYTTQEAVVSIFALVQAESLDLRTAETEEDFWGFADGGKYLGKALVFLMNPTLTPTEKGMVLKGYIIKPPKFRMLS